MFGACADIPGFECATLTVPLAHPDTAGGTLELAVARQAGIGDGLPVLLALAGGPGQSGLAFAATLAKVFAGSEKQLVVLDQRGTGAGALLCPELDAGGDDAIAACGARLGPAAGHFTTADSVADIDDLRQALGVEAWSIAGVSYGTLVALQYARTHPERVIELVLDSTLPPAGLSAFEVESLLAAPRVLNALCPYSACSSFTSNLVADTAAVVARLTTPLAGSIVGPKGRRLPVVIPSASRLFAMLEWTDLHSAMRALFPAAVAAARAGDDRPLLRLAWVYATAVQASKPPPTLFSEALNFATICADIRFPWLATDPLAVRQQARMTALAALSGDFRPFDADAIAHFGPSLGCLRWPLTSLSGALTDAPPRALKTLILGGQVDIRTPIENAAAVAAQLAPMAQVEIVPNVGHSVLTAAPCAQAVAVNFLVRNIGGPISLGCEQQQPAYSVRLAPRHLRDLPRSSGLTGGAAVVAAVVDATLRDAFAVAVAVSPTGGSVAAGGLRGGRLKGRWDAQQVHLVLRRYALVPGTRVSGSVTIDLNGTRGTLYVAGKVAGQVRYRGHHAFVTGRERGAEATPAVVGDHLVPRLPDETLPPIP
jgi:pimeloyl-ACP methyl ester carboxylesterase